ncbi:hypothetical protein GSI_04058 [Ganoderma sinense ZZ0214-1]|uniref:Uncharacterized protein n=1 Tax=Ganoderma sinense ZZ0214-1 TaxID=1077348 RepID=A0A2G8SI37_9APHY|nr:hypothetical protein GSI_04058 [Ganoderma sinense ZZ0214-1]
MDTAALLVTQPGNGSASDLTTLLTSGQAGPISFGNLCVVVNNATESPFLTDCSIDPAEVWNVTASASNSRAATISNANGNCLTLGEAADGAPVTLEACSDELEDPQLWSVQVVSA